MGQVWHVTEGSPTGLGPGWYAEDEAALDSLLADPTTEHASVPAGAPSPLVHGQRARVATPEQAEVLRAHESRPAPLEPCSPQEIEAWEAWAKDNRYDMGEHPLHYLFLDHRTAAARKGWKAGLEFARKHVAAADLDRKQAVERVHEIIAEINGAEAKGVLAQSIPGIRHWLHRVLDFLTGEDHSGCTSLPAPKRRA